MGSTKKWETCLEFDSVSTFVPFKIFSQSYLRKNWQVCKVSKNKQSQDFFLLGFKRECWTPAAVPVAGAGLPPAAEGFGLIGSPVTNMPMLAAKKCVNC